MIYMHSTYYKIYRDYRKVYKILLSCECKEHLDVANKVITLFYMKYDDNRLLERLEKKYKLLNQNF
jgi:uncharacterized protein (UPF0276 family)